VHPGGAFADPDSAAFDIAKTIGGDAFSSLFVAGLIVAQGASGLAAQASASRLLYAMGRDAVLPRQVFGAVSPRFHTPVFNVVLVGVAGLIALRLDVTTSTSFINFGAFTAFTFVNLSVIALFLRTRGGGVMANVVVPAAGAAIDLWLLTRLDHRAITVGLIWLALGVCVLAWLTRLFRDPPPEMQMAELVASPQARPAVPT
jgi:putrescine importer